MATASYESALEKAEQQSGDVERTIKSDFFMKCFDPKIMLALGVVPDRIRRRNRRGRQLKDNILRISLFGCLMGLSAMLRRSRRVAFTISPARAYRWKKRDQRTVCMASAPNFPLFYSDLYTYPLPMNHRFPMDKYESVRKRLQSDALLQNSTFTAAPLATRRELEAVHCRHYVQRVLTGRLSASEERMIGLPWSLAGVRRALGSTGGTVGAMREVLNGARLAGQVAGGTHHARRESGAGFCVFNDMAVAAREGIRCGVRGVVLLDFDVHQGEGSAAIFRGDSGVKTVSFHAESNYPFVKEISDVDVGFRDGVGDEEYLNKVKEVVPEVLDGAEVVILQMGVDGLGSDRLGRLKLTREGLSKRNRFVYGEMLRRGIRGVVTMGGGYAQPIERSIEAHCDVYTDAVACLAEW